MLVANKSNSIHKAWLYRILTNIADNSDLIARLRFKGGTCAAMRGFLDRFSVDLDFDIVADKNDFKIISTNFEKIFKELDLKISDRSDNIPQYFLKYKAEPNTRSTIKIDTQYPPPASNKYEFIRLIEIDRIIPCQTIETMFANKLVALIDRFEKQNTIAGRDLYDIHSFFIKGFKYSRDVITERRNGQSISEFFNNLITFIEANINLTIIDQDLNSLLPPDKFRQIRKTIKNEVIMFIRNE